MPTHFCTSCPKCQTYCYVCHPCQCDHRLLDADLDEMTWEKLKEEAKTLREALRNCKKCKKDK